MHYLTVPDMLWINIQVTGAPQAYNYATLEEATFYQYSQGTSTDLARQAARFLTGFVRLQPFASGNEATAFVGWLAFLAANGHGIDFSGHDATAWVKHVWSNPDHAVEAVRDAMVAKESHGRFGVPETGATVEGILAEFHATVQALQPVSSH
ncbi:MAG: hypothetical protein JSS66_18785 [Armatimonadetes bacterium]|nr:hypothetical protein [Armatimonadota bacterium]